MDNPARFTRPLFAPWRDALAAMEHALRQGGSVALIQLGIALLASWCLYVPVHELMHAWGCLLAGGQVSRLEIDEIYGGALLSGFLPYVVAGSEYAGRLSGFDTGGSDAVYMTTVFFPYLLTLFPGVALLQHATRLDKGSAWAFGVATPLAFAPFLAIAGDYYEMGAILLSRLLAGVYPEAATRWRGDDFTLIWSNLPALPSPGGWSDRLGLAASLALGTALAFATYALGARIAQQCMADPRQP
jgi:hypothetical protein